MLIREWVGLFELRVNNKGRHFVVDVIVSQFQKYGNKTICRAKNARAWIREIVAVLGSKLKKIEFIKCLGNCIGPIICR